MTLLKRIVPLYLCSALLTFLLSPTAYAAGTVTANADSSSILPSVRANLPAGNQSPVTSLSGNSSFVNPLAGSAAPVQLTPSRLDTNGAVSQPDRSVAPPKSTADSKPELSPLEQAAKAAATTADNKPVPQVTPQVELKQYGYNHFRPDAQGFAPMTDIPVGPDYVVGTGDRLVLTTWGSIEGTYELEINRSGEIILPRIGAVNVAGITFGKLPALLKSQLGKVFKDFELTLTMGKLRIIKVYLLGEVESPGDYSLTSLSTIFNALAAAGGPTRNGSLRNITVRRGASVIDTVDLYDFFLKGDKSRDIRLHHGDTIFVPNIGPVAGMSGNVRRPALYELKGENNLKELLALAGGIIPTGYLQRLQIARIDPHNKKLVTDIYLDPNVSAQSIDEQTAAVPVQDMDLVKIFPIDTTQRGYVRLDGYILRPGDYALKPGMRIDQLISKEDLLFEYYTGAGQIIRLYPPDYHPEVLYFNVDSALAKDQAHNLELQEFDTVRIFSRWEMEEMPKVRAGGEVQKPGEYRLFKNMRVRDLLMLAGNLRQTAYLPSAEINRINKTAASITSFPIDINLGEALKGNPAYNILLEQYDELTVRKIPDWMEETERYITLKGEFVFPGTYPVFKGEQLSSVIKRAGGFTPKAYLEGAKFTRVSVREQQQKGMDAFIANAELEVNTKMTDLAATSSSPEELAASKATLEGASRNLQILKAAKVQGRMVLNLQPLDQFAGSPSDIKIMGGDTLEVPQSSSSVAVLGRVVNPTSFVHIDQQNLDYYLSLAGGTTADSNAAEIYVVRANGSIFSRQQYSSLASLFGGGFLNETIAAGDTIVVPQQFERTPVMRTIKDITTILAQIAVTVGVVLVGLNNN